MECIFCKIVKGEVPTFKLYEDNLVMAFLDIRPATKAQFIVIPKEHYENLLLVPDEILGRMMEVVKRIAIIVSEKYGAKGFNIVSNNGQFAGQTVPHASIYVIPRYNPKEERQKIVIGWAMQEGNLEELKKIMEEIGGELSKNFEAPKEEPKKEEESKEKLPKIKRPWLFRF